MTPAEAAQLIKREARRLGFSHAGVTRKLTPERADFFKSWCDDGRAAGMSWIVKHAALRLNPAEILPSAQTAIVLARPYPAEPIQPAGFRLARYAFGSDYHDTMRADLNTLRLFIEKNFAGSRQRAFVDTGPILERDLAAKAGLGWIGKNTCLLTDDLGSYVFLAVILTDIALSEDAPIADACGSCRLCLDACPTGALRPYELDPRLCLAYHNIEARGPRDESFWSRFGDRLVGCDDCQDVCPWNRRDEPDFSAETLRSALPDLPELLTLDEGSYRQRIRGTAISRVKYLDFMRNVFLVAAGTQRADLLPAIAAWRERHADCDLPEWKYCVQILGALGS